jgi:hypothetical protein
VSIQNPKGRWVIVPQFLRGTDPTGSTFVDDARDLFTRGSLGGFSVADFWWEQTLGLVDISGSVVLPWLETGWGITGYPGQTGGVGRDSLRNWARDRVPDMSQYRGVIAVYNFVCNENNVGADVVWSLGGYGSVPDWASATWRKCSRCEAIVPSDVQWASLAGPVACSAGAGGHIPGDRTYMSIADPTVPMTRVMSLCAVCLVVYASDRPEPAPAVVECPAGAHHQPLVKVHVLAGWPDPPAERTWSTCRLCRVVTPDGTSSTCLVTKSQHVREALASVHFPFLEFDIAGSPPRSWLLHEMGHAYDFQHGRGLDPRSRDLINDCWPGAYGDRSDVMSYANVASFTPTSGPGAQFGAIGPSLGITHLIDGGVLDRNSDLFDVELTAGSPTQVVQLRPPTAAGTPGWAGARFGQHVVEYRAGRKWDMGVDRGTGPDSVPEPGCVLVRYHPTDTNRLPNLVPSMVGRPFLATGDYHEARAGLADVSVHVDSIAPDGSSAYVRFSNLPATRRAEDGGAIVVPPGSRHSMRWLMVPYVASDSSGSFDRTTGLSVLSAAETFWCDMADGEFYVAGGTALSPDMAADGPDAFKLQEDAATLRALQPADRVHTIVDQLLRWPHPLSGGGHVLPMDWRWFTGLVLVSLDGIGTGFMGSMTLHSGVFPGTKACETTDQPVTLEELPFDLIEMGSDALTQSRLAREMGYAIGVADSVDPFSLTGPAGLAMRFAPPAAGSGFGDRAWGTTGPTLSTMELDARGWLPPYAKVTVTTGESRSASGTVLIRPAYRLGQPRSGVVQATIGPFSFELRTDTGWDSGVGGPVVLAYAAGAGQAPRPMRVGEHITWGGPIPAISGGGDVSVAELSDDFATLSYSLTERPIFMAGGGQLDGGGTLLFSPDGTVHHIPPGDPLEIRAAALIEQLAHLARTAGR